MISDAARREALRLVNEAAGYAYANIKDMDDPCHFADALIRVLQEHSDVAKRVMQWLNDETPDDPRGELQSLILPDDEPDALAVALKRANAKLIRADIVPLKYEDVLKKELEALGYQIVKKEG